MYYISPKRKSETKTSNKSETKNNINSVEVNLKNKINDAFDDLELLKKEIFDVKGNNINVFSHMEVKVNKKASEGHDNFLSERFKNFINDNKDRNKDELKGDDDFANKSIFSKSKGSFNSIYSKFI
jgi:hypothetical protein